MANKKIIKRRWWKNSVPLSLKYQDSKGDIIQSDTLEFLFQLKDKCADIIFLDPPFNLNKKYSKKPIIEDNLKENEYKNYIEQVILRSINVLKDGGALYLYHIPKYAIYFSNILDKHLEFRHWIAISMKNGFVVKGKLYPAHYSLLYFTKGPPSNFNRPKLGLSRCRHCDEVIKDYGGYKEYVKDGINLSDIWDDISPVRHKKYKNRDANELPITILNRVIQISGRRNGVVVDPFSGTGTTLVAAKNHGMRYIGCDIEPDACAVMRRRLKL